MILESHFRNSAPGRWWIVLFLAVFAGMGTFFQHSAHSQDAGASLAPPPVEPGISGLEVPKALVVIETDPSDFLDKVGTQTKVRWRQQYREPPPSAPPTDRLRGAFNLGGLIGDSFLALQARDAQQFKNVNQDVLKHANSLALGDKISPAIMAESKMAESEDWLALRAKLFETQEVIDTLLREQRDEDPAVLVTLGIWLRLFQVTTAIAQADPEMTDKTLCIGSLEQLDQLVALYEQLETSTREDSSATSIGKVLQSLKRNWADTAGHPTPELINSTFEKLDGLWTRMVTVK